ncbi:DNA translocase FtsK [Candidatus Avoscillospira sp. LCP25S3_F1]|uniref:FtsK/SpoIIIE family DNA translocase n=1 Tax=Candidatus Avoscillospira sp. LCP25S3_F1 TaxID=3438825 RepID=UPI003F91B6BE
MAETKKKPRSTSGGKSAKQSTTRRTSAQRSTGKKPIHREVGAVVCLFLGFFLLLGCFGVDALFIKLLRDVTRGLIGSGLYLLPVILLLSFWILLFHRGRPVKFRMVCAFLLPIATGALGQLFGGVKPEWTGAVVGILWRGGINGTAGGLISGMLAMLFSSLFSTVGAVVLFLVIFVIGLLGALNMTIVSVMQAIRNRPRLPEYDPPEEEPVDTAATIVNHVANRHIERVEQRREKKQEQLARQAQQAQERQARSAADFDLPVDEPLLPPQEQPAPKVTHGLRSPDQYLLEQQQKAAGELPPEEAEEKQTVDQEQETVREVLDDDLLEVFDAPVRPMPKPIVPVNPAPSAPALATPAPAAPTPEPPVQSSPVEETPQKVKASDAQQSAAEISMEITMGGGETGEYVFPPVSLLRMSQGGDVDGTEEMRENTERLNATLESFNIEAHIVNVTRGPSVTRYELELDRGVKLSKVTNLADDIALSLGASGVRISAIPNKISVVGIEVPNRLVSTVLARDVLDSKEFEQSKSKISFAVGKDIGGNRIIGDIAKLPHLLIAGTTGSGKSVCMNSLIISLLFKARPDEVRLIMVDPKMVELGIYNGIPHLLIPVVTDPKKAAGALQWAVTEMMRRYRAMADAGVRDLDSYNKLVKSMDDERKPMEQVVVVIDELADLMLVAAKEVEESICRIAQMGRASGIHLVIATQRPSADVITGLMKANIPSRIAFAVASAMESRIILDTQGAEKLVGKGDMLYAPLGQGKPKRVQGCFITDEEVQEVVSFIKQSSTPNYSDEVQAQIEQKMEQGGKGDGGGNAAADSGGEGDELLPDAVEVILETGQASVSMLQRRLKLGYARAARIVDEMEDRGIVGPFEGSKPRQLLITREQWEVMKNGGTVQPEPPVEEEIP